MGLGERLNGIQEVMGSNPTISMSHMLKVLIVQGFQHIFLFKPGLILLYPALAKMIHTQFYLPPSP